MENVLAEALSAKDAQISMLHGMLHASEDRVRVKESQIALVGEIIEVLAEKYAIAAEDLAGVRRIVSHLTTSGHADDPEQRYLSDAESAASEMDDEEDAGDGDVADGELRGLLGLGLVDRVRSSADAPRGVVYAGDDGLRMSWVEFNAIVRERTLPIDAVAAAHMPVDDEDEAEALCALVQSRKSTLARLVLNDCRMDVDVDRVLASLQQLAGSLTTLALSSCAIGDDQAVTGIAPLIRHATLLQGLDLAFNDIGPAGGTAILEAIAALPETAAFAALSLAANPISDGVVADLASAVEKSATLRYLDISATGMTGEGAMAVALGLDLNGRSRLEWLSLAQNSIQADGVLFLSKAAAGRSSRLRHLNLAGNPLGAEGMGVIADLYYGSSRLESLDVSECGIGDNGAVVMAQAIAQATGRRRRPLRRFLARGNNVNDAAALTQLWAALRTAGAVHIDLSANGAWRDFDAAAADLRNVDAVVLETLALADVEFAPSTLASLGNEFERGHLRTRAMDVAYATVSGNAPLAFHRFSTQLLASGMVAKLVLSQCQLGDQMLVHLASNMMGEGGLSLRHLDLSGNQLSNDSCLSVVQLLMSAPALETLRLSCNAFGDPILLAMADVVGQTKLRTLDLSLNDMSNHGLAHMLRHVGSLHSLDVTGNDRREAEPFVLAVEDFCQSDGLFALVQLRYTTASWTPAEIKRAEAAWRARRVVMKRQRP